MASRTESDIPSPGNASDPHTAKKEAGMTEGASLLIAGDALKASTLKFTNLLRAKVAGEQSGLLSIFDSWFTRVVTPLDGL